MPEGGGSGPSTHARWSHWLPAWDVEPTGRVTADATRLYHASNPAMQREQWACLPLYTDAPA
eukprot:5111207-Pyramimonas_sp.AAC.1